MLPVDAVRGWQALQLSFEGSGIAQPGQQCASHGKSSRQPAHNSKPAARAPQSTQRRGNSASSRLSTFFLNKS